jgi:dihydrofolate reductase
MRKLIVTMWQSLDGFIAGPNNEMDWITSRYDAQMGDYENKLIEEADTLLLGRVTYESFAGAWPKVPENPEVSDQERAYARRLNAMQKVVFSHTLTSAEWQNTLLVHEDLGGTVRALKQESGKEILIYGSASIVRQLTDLRLIDEYQLMIYPVALGKGKPLFAGLEQRADFKLCRTLVHGSGVIEFTYEPAPQL